MWNQPVFLKILTIKMHVIFHNLMNILFPEEIFPLNIPLLMLVKANTIVLCHITKNKLKVYVPTSIQLINRSWNEKSISNINTI